MKGDNYKCRLLTHLKTRHRELVGMQPGDVPVTYADSSALERDFGFKPSVDIRTGLRRFCEWYKEYYG